MIGRINSIQTLGTVDGPGVRFVVFMQGCNLRCSCCHNPDTWEPDGGYEITAAELLEKVNRYRPYFGADGGITISGGEPLLQASFLYELFYLCKQHGINTCLDTSGSILNEDIKRLLSVTDRVLLDIKYTNDIDYCNYVGCRLDTVLNFLAYVNTLKIPTTIRQVIIPTINASKANIVKLRNLIKKFNVVDSIELLPFRKLCMSKYDSLQLPFVFSDMPEASDELINQLTQYL